jgi:DNA-binding NtrC family response regulator
VSKVLIVEDEVGIRELIGESLRSLGVQVLETANTLEAKQACNEQCFDVVVTDIVLPGNTSGTDFARSLIQSQPHVRVVFITGWLQYGRDAENIAAMPEGSFVILQKPFSMEAVTDAVNRFLHGIRSAGT